MSKFSAEVIDALEQARDLILAGHCVRQAWGLLPDGRVAFDATGALARSSRTSRIFDAGKAALEVGALGRWLSLADYNDASTTADVLRLYGSAITITRQAAA